MLNLPIFRSCYYSNSIATPTVVAETRGEPMQKSSEAATLVSADKLEQTGLIGGRSVKSRGLKQSIQTEGE